MPKKFIRRFLPDHKAVREQKALAIFGTLLHDANLWHLNRRSAAGAFAIGLFFAFWPVPFQMWLAAALAIPCRVNLPLSMATVWITNPFTMPPLFYGAYLVGVLALGEELQSFSFEPSWAWVMESIHTIGPAFLVGCAICAVIASIIGYFGMNLLWRWSVVRNWNKRREARRS